MSADRYVGDVDVIDWCTRHAILDSTRLCTVGLCISMGLFTAQELQFANSSSVQSVCCEQAFVAKCLQLCTFVND